MTCKILVVEDEEYINELICLNLETAGYTPVSFFGGTEVSTHLLVVPPSTYGLAVLDDIGRIRKKTGFQKVIKTVPRIGYRLEDQ